MKNIKIYVLLLAMIATGTIGFVSCQKQQKEVATLTQYKSNPYREGSANRIKIKGAFRWDGTVGNGSSENCRGGDCGQCPGICLIIQFSTIEGNVSHQEYMQGYGSAFIWLQDNQLVMEPHRTVDNGDQKVRITHDFQIGSQVSQLLGYEMITIQKGIYAIEYNTENPYGIIKFNVECS
ncbi:MAG: hypothetical protein NZ455_14765 [Bacteroidia bacterium]|nr:hypothetical protein [Bacteroidia bacterium]MDW8346859.1 hypothetical protein [Bacteroidia bacterium]